MQGLRHPWDHHAHGHSDNHDDGHSHAEKVLSPNLFRKMSDCGFSDYIPFPLIRSSKFEDMYIHSQSMALGADRDASIVGGCCWFTYLPLGSIIMLNRLSFTIFCCRFRQRQITKQLVKQLRHLLQGDALCISFFLIKCIRWEEVSSLHHPDVFSSSIQGRDIVGLERKLSIHDLMMLHSQGGHRLLIAGAPVFEHLVCKNCMPLLANRKLLLQ